MGLEDVAYWKSLINMSVTRFLILRTLRQEPSHGYAILQKVQRFTEGCCTPTHGAIYPVLKELVEGNYATVRSERVEGRERRVYGLTKKGKQAYETAIEAWEEVLPFLIEMVVESNQ